MSHVLNSSSVFKQVVSVTPLYRYRCVSILPKLYITTRCLCTLSTLNPCLWPWVTGRLISPLSIQPINSHSSECLVTCGFSSHQTGSGARLCVTVLSKFCLKTKQGVVYPHVLIHRWRYDKIMCHTGAGVDMEPAVDFCIPMCVGQQNVTEGDHSQKTEWQGTSISHQ